MKSYRKVAIWVQSSNPYNSINLQSVLLRNMIVQAGWGNVELLHSGVPNVHAKLKQLVAGKNLLIWQFGGFDPFLSWKIARRARTLFIYHNITPARYFFPSEPKVAIGSFLGRLQLRTLPRSVNWATCSPFNMFELKRLGFKRVALLPNIVEHASATRPCKMALKKNIILFVGRIAPNKRCLRLIDAALRASEILVRPIELVIVGRSKKGSSEGRRLKHKIGLIKRHPYLKVRWLQSTYTSSDLAQIYSTATLYVSASRHEGFGLPVFEAIIRGKPAIYMRCGGTESILKGIGMVADDSRLGSSIARLLSSERNRHQLLYKQRAVAQEFSPWNVWTIASALFKKTLSEQ